MRFKNRYFIITALFVFLLALFAFKLPKKSNFYVLGASTYLADKEGKANDSQNQSGSNNQEKAVEVEATEKPEPTEEAEPTEIPEPTEKPEPTDLPKVKRQIEQVKQVIERQVRNRNLNRVEVSAPEDENTPGEVVLEYQNKFTQKMKAPVATATAVTQLNTPAGEISVNVGGVNNVTIKNGPYTIVSKFPVIINPEDSTIAIRTPSGVTLIKTLPTQFFQHLPSQSRLSSVSSLTLNDNQGVPVYEAEGIQVKKLLGIFPIQAQVQEQINAQTGEIITIREPWYFSLFNFAFQSI